MFHFQFIVIETDRASTQSVSEAIKDIIAHLAHETGKVMEAPDFDFEGRYFETTLDIYDEKIELVFFCDGRATQFGGDIVLKIRVGIKNPESPLLILDEKKLDLSSEIMKALYSWPETARVGHSEWLAVNEYMPAPDFLNSDDLVGSTKLSSFWVVLRILLFFAGIGAILYFTSWFVGWRSVFGVAVNGWAAYVMPLFDPAFALLSSLPFMPAFGPFTKAYFVVGIATSISVRLAHKFIGNTMTGISSEIFWITLSILVWPIVVVAGLFTSASSHQTTEQKNIFIPIVLGPFSMVFVMALINLVLGFV